MGASGSISNTVAKGLQGTVNSVPLTIIDDANNPSPSDAKTPDLWAQAHFGGEPSKGNPRPCEFRAEQGCRIDEMRRGRKRKRGEGERKRGLRGVGFGELEEEEEEEERDVVGGATVVVGAAVGDDEMMKMMMLIPERGEYIYHHPHHHPRPHLHHHRGGIVDEESTSSAKLAHGIGLLIVLGIVVGAGVCSYQKIQIQKQKQKQKQKSEGLGWKMVDEAEKGGIVA